MLNYLDILDRAQTGPYISEENWDLEKIAMTTRRLVKKYKLEWNPNELVTDDAALSEAIWKAGYEMAVELGSYSRSTERIIQLSQDEIDSGIRNMPQEVVMGEGPIRHIGEFEVQVTLHADVHTTVKVIVVSAD